MYFHLDFLAEQAAYEHLVLRMLDLREIPMAFWYPTLPSSAALGNYLRYARVGHRVDRWFSMPLPRGEVGWQALLATRLVAAATRLSACPLPWPRPLAVENAEAVLHWAREVGVVVVPVQR